MLINLGFAYHHFIVLVLIVNSGIIIASRVRVGGTLILRHGMRRAVRRPGSIFRLSSVDSILR